MHIGVVGGGVAGLYSAILLRREGHEVTVYEADDHVGGRIRTHRFQSATNEDVFFEAGAMRIPRSSLHESVFDLIRYINTHSIPEDKIDLAPYVLEHENNVAYVQEKKVKVDDPTLGSWFGVPECFHGKSPRELLGEVVTPWLVLLRKDFDTGFQQILKHDELSFRRYLREVMDWPHEVIELVEMMESQTNQYDLSFTEIIMQNLDFDTKDWVTIKGGMSRLTQSASNLVGSQNLHLNSPVKRIVELPNGKVQLTTSGSIERTGEFDKIILAMPPAALQHIQERPIWNFMKEQSIRGMHYEPLYKIGLHFRTRFWERSLKPSFGGQSTTDLRFRWIVYPSNDLGSSGSGVLLLYCWMTDAMRWQSMSREERNHLALHDLNKFFQDTEPAVDVYEQFIQAFDVLWSCDKATGDAMFLPGQFSRYFAVARQSEGNIHFAGEHLSRHHTWISGALDSSLQAVREVLSDDQLKPLGKEFVTRDASNDWRSMLMSSRYAKYTIPQNMNIQYVKVS